jgi:lipopolysaccharide/colanic/teichoic acid biosynthesis glycosyltransferase
MSVAADPARPGARSAVATLGSRAGRVDAAPPGSAKRAFDLTLASLGLAVSAPIWVVVALAIWIDDGRPIFYAQERVGYRGRAFRVLKFRSMIANAERGVGAVQARQGDSRVTSVGRRLRATALDELPQLLSIAKGDMSFVGPRALRPGEIEVRGDGRHELLEDVPGFDERCAVRPGLTGVAQVYAPRDLPRRQKFRYDRVYITRQSLGLDLRLIARSFWITFRGAWETQGRKR